MRVTTFALGPLGTNSYLLDDGQQALAIDVGGDPAEMLNFLQDNQLTLVAILITHQHFDHLYGVKALADATKAPVYVPGEDAAIANTEAAQGGIWGMPMVPAFTAQDLPRDELSIGNFTVKIIFTPGHTPGGVSFYFPEDSCVFTGDALFYRSIGRTDFPLGNHETLIRSIKNNLFCLPDQTKVYPGHGPATDIGTERNSNPFIGDFADSW